MVIEPPIETGTRFSLFDCGLRRLHYGWWFCLEAKSKDELHRVAMGRGPGKYRIEDESGALVESFRVVMTVAGPKCRIDE